MPDDLYAAMRNAPTIRYYTDEPVDPAVLHRVLDNARFAPSGGNRQAWGVVVVTDPVVRAKLAELYQEPWVEYLGDRISPKLTPVDDFARNLGAVPVHLVVLARLARLALTDDRLDRPSIVGGASVYPFVQNVLLGVAAEGLGAALTTLLTRNEPAALELLGVPDGWAMAAMVAIGHPAKRPGTLNRGPVEGFAHDNRFGVPWAAVHPDAAPE